MALMYLSQRGLELAYAEATANKTGITSTLTDWTELTITFMARTRPVMLEAFISGAQNTHASVSGLPSMQMLDSANVQQGGAGTVSVAAGAFAPAMFAAARLGSLVSGQLYTFKVAVKTTSTSTANFIASATQRAYLQAVEV